MFQEIAPLKVIAKDNIIIIQKIRILITTKKVETIIHHQIIHLTEAQDLPFQEVARPIEAVDLCQDHREEEEEEDKI